MTEQFAFKRAEDDINPKVNEWCLDQNSKLDVDLKCGNGHLGSLGKRSGHTISSDGVISPSVQCPKCEFHVMGQLIGWVAPDA